MSIEALYDLYLQHPVVVTDTRKIVPGSIFFALKGDNFNGNTFAAEALQKGAVAAVIDEAAYATSPQTILVDDVLTTLQNLARHHRMQFNIPFIAITGSNGKTTTKELVYAVLASHFITYTTQGNLNNHIGVPLTLLSIQEDAQMAVIEMGANHQKEIAGYCEYTKPNYGIITNCGKAHLEGFGGVEGVRKGKGELYDYLRTHGGSAFVMHDYDYLRSMSRGITEIFSYGTADADVEGHTVKSEPFLEVALTRGSGLGNIKTQLVGDYNLPNVLTAVAVGTFFKVPEPQLKAAIENYAPSNSRSQLVKKGSNTIILDAYNANPSSMKLAIENLAALPASNKILLLGAMAELGYESLAEHEAIAALIAQHEWKEVVLVGGDFNKMIHPYHKFNNAGEAAEWFAGSQFENCYILIKGSRSMQMEKVLG
jgi:UDP-N-acetylmuramoyl-tripeptide--D-alanyl-D-alanine ligase